MSLNTTNSNPVAASGPGGREDKEELPQPPHFVLPVELFDEVTSYLKPVDVGNLRITSKYMDHMNWNPFLRKLMKDKTLCATFASMSHFLGMLNVFAWRSLGSDIKELCLLADGLKAHEYGYDWAWENLLQEDLTEKDAQGKMLSATMATDDDMRIIDDANERHSALANINNGFVNGGGYRSMLIAVLNACPNLNVLNIRKLKADEHMPGWFETEKFEKLSFYKPGMNTKDIFYGDWQYDTVHLRVTHYTDEFGDAIVEPNAGPQASFMDDVEAAITTSRRPVAINFIRD